MPRSKHDVMKRRLAQVHGHLDVAMAILVEMESQFRPHHSDLADALMACAQGSLAVQELMLKFWEAAWGKRPDNMDSWL